MSNYPLVELIFNVSWVVNAARSVDSNVEGCRFSILVHTWLQEAYSCAVPILDYIQACDRVERESDLFLDVLGEVNTLEVASWSEMVGARAIAQLYLEFPTVSEGDTVFLPVREFVKLLKRYGESKASYQNTQLNVWIYDIPGANQQTSL